MRIGYEGVLRTRSKIGYEGVLRTRSKIGQKIEGVRSKIGEQTE